MTPRERMYAALEGKPVDRIPVAPYFWGAEYAWKLTGRPLWEVMHGAGDMGLAILEALHELHHCDWLIPLHASSGQLAGKKLVREDSDHLYFADDSGGEELVWHKEGHWLVPASQVGEARVSNEGSGVEPPRSKSEADDWLKRHCPYVFEERKPRPPHRKLRERFPDMFLCCASYAPFAGLAYTMGFEPALVLLHENPSLCTYIIERMIVHMPVRFAEMAADGYDAGLMCDSWASADIMSPDTYANWVGPIHKMFSDELHRVGLKSIIYNTGNIMPLLDTIAAMGYDAISPEERIKGVEMDIGEIRRVVGPDVCLFGNFDAYLLMRGDREAIRAEVLRQINAAGPDAFVMGTGSPVCDATDPEVIDFWIGEVHAAYTACWAH